MPSYHQTGEHYKTKISSAPLYMLGGVEVVEHSSTMFLGLFNTEAFTSLVYKEVQNANTWPSAW